MYNNLPQGISMKRIMIVIGVAATVLQGAELKKQEYKIENSKITLQYGDSQSIGNIARVIGYLVVGSNEQRILTNTNISLMPSKKEAMGRIECPSSAVIRDSTTDDSDTPFTLEKVRSFSSENIVKLDLPKSVCIVKVQEPTILWCSKAGIDTKKTYYYERGEGERYWGKEALNYAQKDLKTTYMSPLDKLKNQENGKKRTIAFTSLSTEVGFPIEKAAEVAVATIGEFLKNSSHALPFYVYLLVKHQKEYDIYQNLLEKVCNKNK